VREHQVPGEAFPQRVRAHETFELGDELRVTSCRQIRFDSDLDRAEPLLFQLRRRTSDERLEEDVAERRPAPGLDQRSEFRT
jgi:hypothetical protein